MFLNTTCWTRNLTLAFLPALLLMLNGLVAHAQPAPKFYPLTVTASGSLAKSTILPEEETKAQLKADASGATASLAGPGAGYSFTWSVVSKMRRETRTTGTWASTNEGSISFIPPQNPNGADSQLSEMKASFSKAGYYQVVLKASATWWYGSGEDRGSGSSQPPYLTMEFNVGGTLTVSASADHLEADGEAKSIINVHIDDADGNPLPDMVVSMGSDAGTLENGSVTTNANGDGVAVDENNEPLQTTLTAPNTGAMAKISAQSKTLSGEKFVLFHKVVLSDFSSPKLLTYDPDSSDTAKQNPQFTFTISDQPAVAANFTVTYSIHELEGHDPIATKTETLAPGTYTRSWSDFFYTSQPINGKVPDPGTGIYPFQIEAAVSALKPEKVEDITDKNCTHADWKSSKTLTIEWTNADIHYDDIEEKTMVSYAFRITNAAREDAPPVNTNLVIYDPDMQPAQTIPVTLHPTLDSHHIFYATSSFSFEEMLKAGKYHFVVEARQQDNIAEGKDRNKLAIERNQSKNVPTFVTFGGKSPAATIGNEVYGQTLDGSAVSGTAAAQIQATGYRVWDNPGRRWWMQNYCGVYRDGFRTVKDVVASVTGRTPTAAEIKAQTIQYSAVWLYSGHGAGGDTMAIWNAYTGIPTDRSTTGIRDDSWSWLTARQSQLTSLPATDNMAGDVVKISLDSLPNTWSVTPQNQYGTEYAPLAYSRLVCFMGCATANGQPTDLPLTAVSLGALSSIGFLSGVDESVLNEFTKQFFTSLKRGVTIRDAAISAADNTVGTGRCEVIRGVGNTLTPPSWRDGIGPDRF